MLTLNTKDYNVEITIKIPVLCKKMRKVTCE